MKWYAWMLLIIAVVFGAIPGMVGIARYLMTTSAKAKVAEGRA